MIVHWFRQDLRLDDNPSFFYASQNDCVFPIYILDNENAQDCFIGSASRWWLNDSLKALKESLDGHLSLYIGNPIDILIDLVKKFSIHSIYWNRCYEPWRIKRDINIKNELTKKRIKVKTFNSSLLWEPWNIKKYDGSSYKIFTHFYQKGCLLADSPRKPLPNVQITKNLFYDKKDSLLFDQINLLPKIQWYKKLESYWKIGEKAAVKCFEEFITNKLCNYKQLRDFPDKFSVSRISPYLHFGEISIHKIWYKINNLIPNENTKHFCNELAWREFAYNQIYYNPLIYKKNLKSQFNQFPWEENKKFFLSWKKGQTGIPMVDAGMRELWETGYIHNRVRMIVGSFLVKNLNIHWNYGERWFWDCLVDADLASNSANWQWIAGCGYDSSPYYRIFNPVRQGQKFDQDGNYIRKFIPEISALPNKYLFSPWEFDKDTLKSYGIVLGENYPKPIVDLQYSRKSSLELFYKMKNN